MGWLRFWHAVDDAQARRKGQSVSRVCSREDLGDLPPNMPVSNLKVSSAINHKELAVCHAAAPATTGETLGCVGELAWGCGGETPNSRGPATVQRFPGRDR